MIFYKHGPLLYLNLTRFVVLSNELRNLKHDRSSRRAWKLIVIPCAYNLQQFLVEKWTLLFHIPSPFSNSFEIVSEMPTPA